MRSFVPFPNAITEDTGNGLRRPLIQYERTLTEIKVCLIEDLNRFWWLFVQAVTLKPLARAFRADGPVVCLAQANGLGLGKTKSN